MLVVRDKLRLNKLAARLCQAYGISVDVLRADLTQRTDLFAVETRLRDDARIGILINNAGSTRSGSFISQAADALPEVMEVGESVEAALVGFDRREPVTIPPLHDAIHWEALETGRRALLSDLRQAHARRALSGRATKRSLIFKNGE